MDSYDARLLSFSSTTRVGKGKKAQELKWPHPPKYGNLSPAVLADAGFYFAPSPDDPDNVVCFMCGKELGGWVPTDEPHLIHYDKCRDRCGWAAARCGLEVDKDGRGRYKFKDPERLPSSERMVQARLDTFGSRKWPHDGTKGHGASSRNLAKAGFVATPRADSDDTATCLYCQIVLQNWQFDDVPLEEHHTQASEQNVKCAFLTSLPEPPPPKTARPLSRASSRATVDSNTSKPSRSRRSTKAPARPPSPDEGEEGGYESTAAEAEMGENIATGSSESGSLGRSTRGRPRATNADGAAPPMKAKGGRGGKASVAKGGTTRRGRSVALSEIDTDAAEEEDGRRSRPKGKKALGEKEEEEANEPGAVKKAKGVRKKSSRKTIVKEEPEYTSEIPSEKEEEADVVTAKPARKGRSTTVTSEPPTQAKPMRKTRSKSIARNAALSDAEDDDGMPPPPVPPKNRRVTQSRQVSGTETEDVEPPPPPPKAKRGARSRSVVRSPPPVAQSEEESVVRVPRARKAPAAKVSARQAPSGTETEDVGESVPSKAKRQTRTRSIAPAPASDEEEEAVDVITVIKKPVRGRSKEPAMQPEPPAPKAKTAAIEPTFVGVEIKEKSKAAPRLPSKQSSQQSQSTVHSFGSQSDIEEQAPPVPPKPSAPTERLPSARMRPPSRTVSMASLSEPEDVDVSLMDDIDLEDIPPKPKSKGKLLPVSKADESLEAWDKEANNTPPLPKQSAPTPVVSHQAPVARQRVVSRREPPRPFPAKSQMSSSQSLRASQAPAPARVPSPEPVIDVDMSMPTIPGLSDEEEEEDVDAVDVNSDEDTMAFRLHVARAKKAKAPPSSSSVPSSEPSKSQGSLGPPEQMDVDATPRPPLAATKQMSPPGKPATPEPRTPDALQSSRQRDLVVSAPANDSPPPASMAVDAPAKSPVPAPASIPPTVANTTDALPHFDPTSLTEEERQMTVEEWIRLQMEKELVKAKEEMDAYIREFEKQVAEQRAVIEAL